VIDRALFDEGGVGRDQIPALTDPRFVPAGNDEASYLLPTDRVVGLVVEGRALAIPHNILWWHEIVNLNLPGLQVAVTYCPLTGSAIAFDRAAVDGAEFGVSGLLFQNNLIMFDRSGLETLWPQMLGLGACGLRKGLVLPRVPVTEMTWQAWLGRHPNTEVVSGETGFSRDYTRYPYGEYERLDEPPFIPGHRDPRRPPKERVLGVAGPQGDALAFPFLALDALGPVGAVNETVDGAPVLAVWDRAGASALAFSRRPVSDVALPGSDPGVLTFRVEDGRLVDDQTGTIWDVDGRPISGELVGWRLPQLDNAFVAFWFAWSSFHRDTRLWTN